VKEHHNIYFITATIHFIISLKSEAEKSAANNKTKQTNKLRGFSPQANYTDRATAACR
jgi:hypothetical protein